MLSKETTPIQQLVQDVSRYLDHLQRQNLLWADVDNHIAASHIAEYVGNFALVPVHLQTVMRLLVEIHTLYPPTKRNQRTR